MKHTLTIYFSLVFLSLVYSQPQINIDSLKRSLNVESVDSLRFIALDQLGDHYAYHGKSEARTYINEIQKLADRTNNRNYQNTAYKLLANLANRQNKQDSARHYFNLEIQNVDGDSAQIGDILTGFGATFYREGKYDSLVIYELKALKLLEEYNPTNLSAISSACNLLGIGYELKQRYELSIDYYQKSLDIKRELGNKRSIINTLANLGGVYGILGNNEQENYFHNEMLKLGEEINDQSAISSAHHNFGVSFKNDGEFEKATFHLNKAKAIRLREGYTHEACYTLYVLGNLHRDKGEFEDALTQYKEALTVCNDAQVDRTIGNIHTNRSRVFTKLNRYKQAVEAATQAKQYAEKVNINESKIHAYQVSAEANEKMQNLGLAINDYKNYYALKDSSENAKFNKDIQALQIQYETKEKQSIIDSQKLELLEKTNQRNRYLGGFIFIGSFLSFMLYSSQAREKLQQEKIINLEQKQKLLAIDYMLQGQEEERKRIARDLHDSLGALLSTARLHMQNIQKGIDQLSEIPLFSKAEHLINNACTEVRRIAHDMMPDALINLGFRDAVEDLANKTNTDNKLKITSYFSNEEFDLSESQSVILYRVLQEIISNAIKHAKASTLHIQFTESEKDFFLSIDDNGIGFDPTIKNSDGIGLSNIKHRIKYLNGKLDIHSNQTHGTSFEISIPK